MEGIPVSLLQEGSGPDGPSTPLSSHFGSTCVVIDDSERAIKFSLPVGLFAPSLGLGYPL